MNNPNMNPNQYQAPNNYQPYGAPQPAARKSGSGLDGLVGFIIKLLPILAIVFLGMGATSFLYYFIWGIVEAVDVYSGAFGLFVTFIAEAFGALAKYIIYAAICAGIYKISRK